MKSWIKSSLIAVLAVSTLCGATAMAKKAQPATPEQQRAEWVKQNEVQLAKLELALVLTPEQKPAWEKFKASITARNEAVLNDLEIRAKVDEPKTVIERLQRAEEATTHRAQLLAETRRDVEAFYVGLSDPQKTVFDAEVYRLLPARHGPRNAPGKKGKRGKK